MGFSLLVFILSIEKLQQIAVSSTAMTKKENIPITRKANIPMTRKPNMPMAKRQAIQPAYSITSISSVVFATGYEPSPFFFTNETT